MELKLYNHIRKHSVNESIDLFDKTTQSKIEAYDISIGLDAKILDAVKKYLKDYNRYLESQKLNTVTLRYYQIMALYFTEVYFRNRTSKEFEDFSNNALAYWMATGSGKTIIMHINIFQFIEHNKGFKDLELIMTTPGVNLIEQHEREVTPLIDYLNKIYKNKVRLTIDTTSALLNKADDFFNFPDDKFRQRLILVDEAHIGLGSNQKDDEGEFLKLRRRLNIKHSFLFEYSATFHNMSSGLENEYSKSIIYDYNYNLFYRDGYGKDFYFQKISSDLLKDNYKDNLNQNLTVIEEKLDIFSKVQYRVKNLFHAEAFPDKPLIAFMGNTVNDKTKEGKGEDELSDISEIVKYFAELTEAERATFKHVFNKNHKGNLKLTRNPQADDEILLSYGSGDYWGIINVGNGLNFINNYKQENVEKITSTAIVISNTEKYLFENIDKPQSPINVLIGSRKFAEGWNCFRVSVIGLINLGKTKGNKIIQIFGRGVRLKGLNNDGKRKHISHHIDDYFTLKDNDSDNLKRLETLCVFSLQKSYLEIFTEAISGELEITKSFDISVKPSVIKLNGKEVTYEACGSELNIFKLAKTTVDVKKVFLNPAERKIEYEYILNGVFIKSEINRFSFSLDYRTDKSKDDWKNIRHSLKNINENYQPFINNEAVQKTIIETSAEADIQLYCKNSDNTISTLSIIDVLEYIDEIFYTEDITEFDFDFVEKINWKIAEEFVKKVRNKINWHLNSSIYQYNEPLKQSIGDERGDFIEKYTLVKSFKLSKSNGKPKTEIELNKEIEDFSKTINQIENALMVDNRKLGNHLYSPLLHDNKSVFDQNLKLSPDKLNKGEEKFVKDFADYISQNSDKLKEYDIFLMRNVESLKSIGIYLNDDSEVFYPDFIMWLICKDKVYINFVDPKGQMGTKDFNEDKDKEKITIADKSKNTTLPNIEKELKRIHNKEFILNSFILLRDSSELGKVAKPDWKKENMILKNIFRLDWHTLNEKENSTDTSHWVDGKSYLDWIMEKTFN